MRNRYPEGIIKLLVNEKINFKNIDDYGYSPLVIALNDKNPENIFKLFMNRKK